LTENNTQILSGLRIIELGTDVAAAYAARMCAIYGADVITIEPPQGHAVRHLPPWLGDSEDPEKSILFAHLGVGKRSVCLDVNSPADVSRIIKLILSADGVFDSYPPGYLVDLGIDLDQLADEKPQLCVAHVTPFGQSGPQANWSASSLTAAAAGGQMYLAGDPDKPPMLTAGHQAHYQSGLQAFGGLLTSLYAASVTGTGDILDLSIQEVQAATLEGGGPSALWYGGEQIRGGNTPRAQWGIHECKDGWIGVASMPRQIGSVLDAIGHGDMTDDPLFALGGWDPEANELMTHLIADFAMQYTAAEIFEIADKFRAPFSLIPTPAELLEWPHHKETGFWKEVHHPVLGTHPVPSGPIAFNNGDRGNFTPAPTIGQHTEGVLTELSESEQPEIQRAESNEKLSLPLTGVRVIDMTQVWSGPYGARFLADMGAEVIKVEGPTFPDPIRTAGGNRTVPEINMSAYFSEYNRGKKSLTLDIKQPEGMAALKKLLATSDVFIENWSSGVAVRNGLGYEDLRDINPQIIYISMPGFGHEGSDAGRVGFGPTIEQMGGLVALQGYAGGPPHKSGISYGDPIAGSTCAAAVAAALVNRERTGQGSYCMIPQRDGITGLIGEFIIAESLDCEMPIRAGFAHLTSAPHNVYPTIPDDEPRPVLGMDKSIVSYATDRWIAIDCRTNAEWKRLANLIGDSRLTVGEFETLQDRQDRLEYIDSIISEWASNQHAESLAAELQQAGVTASPVMSSLLMLKSPHLLERNNYIPVEHDLVGTHQTTRPTWRFKKRPDLPTRSGPTFGADNQDILKSLGYSDDEIASMAELRVTATTLL
jgi:crotonobetainyl-CoA:carnitine CoA-transferase CaiB-like acyl-CoA transferase